VASFGKTKEARMLSITKERETVLNAVLEGTANSLDIDDYRHVYRGELIKVCLSDCFGRRMAEYENEFKELAERMVCDYPCKPDYEIVVSKIGCAYLRFVSTLHFVVRNKRRELYKASADAVSLAVSILAINRMATYRLERRSFMLSNRLFELYELLLDLASMHPEKNEIYGIICYNTTYM
jgi:hypothetical protein